MCVAVASRAGATAVCLAACKAAASDAELTVPALRALTAALQSDEARDEFRRAAGMDCLKQLVTSHAGELLMRLTFKTRTIMWSVCRYVPRAVIMESIMLQEVLSEVCMVLRYMWV